MPASSPLQPTAAKAGPWLWIARDHPQRLQEAVICLLGRHRAASQEAENFLTYARDNQLSLDDLVACPAPGDGEGGPLAYAALCAANPGRTAMLLATPPASKSDTRPIASLAAFAISQQDPRNVQLCQALVAPEEHLFQDMLIQAGFSELALLHYMERPANTPIPDAPSLPKNLQLHAYTVDDDLDVQIALESSYEGTLDCPGLRGLRQTPDILAGHKATGAADLKLWWVLRQGQKPVGAIMLATHVNSNSLELTYLGIAPEARGQGAGAAMLRCAFEVADRIQPRTSHLAVDVNNWPAIALYKRFGFVSILERRALIYSLNHDVNDGK